mgnify:FL=1
MRIQSLNTINYNQARKQNDSQPVKEENNNPSFKGGFGDAVGKFYGEKYAEKMLNQKWLHSVSHKLAGASNQMTQHMATTGSLLTSSVYFYQTVTNKKLDADKRNTLGINQVGCFIVPTICAYGVDHVLRNFNKNMEYRYSGLMRKAMADGNLSPEKCANAIKSLGPKLKCFGALMGLATFTVIYRYATPVVITPIANKIGEHFNKKRKENAQEISLNQNNTQNVKENENKEVKQSA